MKKAAYESDDGDSDRDEDALAAQTTKAKEQAKWVKLPVPGEVRSDPDMPELGTSFAIDLTVKYDEDVNLVLMNHVVGIAIGALEVRSVPCRVRAASDTSRTRG